MTTRSYIGRRLPRLEDQRLLRGEGRFTDDWTLANESFAAFVRSPHAHARVLGLRTTAAALAPGVLAVLSGADYQADGGAGIAHAPVPADVVDYQRPAFGSFNGSVPLDEPQPPLATERVRYVGEAVAIVVATSRAAAIDAAGIVEVDYQPLPAVSDAVEAIGDDAPRVGPAGSSSNTCLDAMFGDQPAVEQAIRSADLVVERAFRVQRVANAQLEPRAVVAEYDPDTESYVMVAGSQGVVRQRAALAAVLHLPVDHLRVISPDVGGGFGPRTALYPEQVAVTWAARRVGRPVRWTGDRTEAFLADFQGRDAQARARLALTADGRVLALDADFLFNIGGYTGSYVPLNNAARILPSVYDIPLACVRVRGVLTNTVPTGPYRGAGRPEAMFVLERLLDLAAEALGKPRDEVRRRNLVRREQLPYRSATGLTYASGDFSNNMRRAQVMADWAGFATRRAAAGARKHLAGIGIANYVEAPVGAPHERVHLAVLPEGVVEVTVGTQSTGQGHATTFAQVVADLLGCAPDRVRLISGDTARVSAGGGTHSDRSMRLVGTLLAEACARLLDLAREFDPQREIDLFDLAARHALTAEAAFTGRLPAHPTGTAVCEVEVDPETGAIEVTRYVCVDDVGQPINPLIVEGQVHGGIVQGLGQALSETVVFEPSTAQVLTSSFLDYALPRASGLPTFETDFVEDPTEGNPLRIKGGGESGITPSLAVVVDAVVDALRPLGVTDLEMPLTPARVWEAIQQARSEPAARLDSPATARRQPG